MTLSSGQKGREEEEVKTVPTGTSNFQTVPPAVDSTNCERDWIRQPDRPSYNFKASRPVDRRTLCNSELQIDGFRGSKLVWKCRRSGAGLTNVWRWAREFKLMGAVGNSFRLWNPFLIKELLKLFLSPAFLKCISTISAASYRVLMRSQCCKDQLVGLLDEIRVGGSILLFF